jgi:hypothetical protein
VVNPGHYRKGGEQMAYTPKLRIGAVVSTNDPDGSKHYGDVIALLPKDLVKVKWGRIIDGHFYTKEMVCHKSALTVMY